MTNYPTSDTQFLAQILVKTRTQDQVTVQELHRLDEMAQLGYSSVPLDPTPTLATSHPNATRSPAPARGF